MIVNGERARGKKAKRASNGLSAAVLSGRRGANDDLSPALGCFHSPGDGWLHRGNRGTMGWLWWVSRGSGMSNKNVKRPEAVKIDRCGFCVGSKLPDGGSERREGGLVFDQLHTSCQSLQLFACFFRRRSPAPPPSPNNPGCTTRKHFRLYTGRSLILSD